MRKVDFLRTSWRFRETKRGKAVVLAALYLEQGRTYYTEREMLQAAGNSSWDKELVKLVKTN